MTEKNSKYRLLMSLLAPLLREWGYDAVQQSLADLHAEQGKVGAPLSVQGRKPTKEHRRPSASEIIERFDSPADRKEPLRALAVRFDAKTFLPTASDVRHFLEMRCQNLAPIKHRQDSFRKVLDVLVGMADDELQLLQGAGTYAGPTQLGPLSDAIKATSAAVRGSESIASPTANEDSGEPLSS